MYLVIDTETTGLPKSWKASVTNLNNWPRLVQIAWIQYDKSGTILKTCDYLVKPDGFTIPKAASIIHGITTEKAISDGRSVIDVLNEFELDANDSNWIIAHNMSFDEMVIGAELLRRGKKNLLANKSKICTKAVSTDYCAIPGPRGYKWPTLSELYLSLFGTDIPEGHDALVDAKICAKCFFELKRLQVINLL